MSSFHTTPEEVRLLCRSGEFQSQTSGQANGYAQANLVILTTKDTAFDFLLFCQRNPKPCPLIAVLEAGEYLYNSNPDIDTNDINDMDKLKLIDIRTDLPKYRIFKDGVLVEEVSDIKTHWNENYYTFIIGCSFSFEDAIIRSGLLVRHIELKRNVPMYNTNIPCNPAGQFSGNLVVSMRPFTISDSIKVTQITSRYPRVHGAPIHIGDPVSYI